MPRLICTMGLPRSGKSTLTRALRTRYNAPVVNRDAIRLALHGQRYQALAEPMVKAISQVMIRALFLSGHDTVLCDETNFSRVARDFLKSDDWTTEFCEVTTSAEVCKARAVATGQPDLLPVIDNMAARYEALGPDEVRYVDD